LRYTWGVEFNSVFDRTRSMSETVISHAFVLPDDNFEAWLAVLRPYTQKFERVAVVRSPRGNDLNRYRNVTAINAPLTWTGDDALKHIRRIYPMVVRVDVINAKTPQELTPIIQKRITDNDRYGEKSNTPVHIFDRFILEYPVQYSPMAIVDPFDEVPTAENVNFGVDFASAKGARVLSSTVGKVTQMGNTFNGLKMGNFVTVSTLHEGKTYRVSYFGLDTTSIPLNTNVSIGQALGTALGNSIKLVVQEATTGAKGYPIPEVLDPTKSLYITNLRVRPKDKGLRVRSTPSTSGVEVTRANPWDLLETLEMHGRTLTKVGKNEQWLRVKTPDGQTGYAAAWFLDATIKTPNKLSGINAVGVNLDLMHPAGTPPANKLGKVGWLRFGYNVSNNVGSTDINAAYTRYAPVVERYVKAGYKVIMTTSHQTYGEGQGFVWELMDDGRWDQLITRFAEMMYKIMRQWADKGLVEAWQVWNEQDAELNAHASVPVTPSIYHLMLRKIVPAMRAGDAEATILTGGYTGTQSAENYAKQSLKGLPVDAIPDGVAIHPYGRSPRRNDKYGHFGSLDEWLRAYLNVMPGKPLWITEWGVLNAGGENPQDIGDYAMAFINHIKQNYGNQVAAIIWYAWAEGMHNGYGLVDGAQNSRAGLTDRFLNA
jgi:murein DD-endopeptidase MepM/ murein hydrolase activator NlpD